MVLGAQEYYYGQGLQQGPAGRTPFGSPVQVVDLGTTQLPEEVIQDFLEVRAGSRSSLGPQAAGAAALLYRPVISPDPASLPQSASGVS